jgi:hypothetical protein
VLRFVTVQGIPDPMPLPLNRVFLTSLADVDLITVLVLTEVSSSLYHFILEEVLTISALCRFLRKNQYVFQPDQAYFRLFSNQEIILLHRAFEALRRRHGECFYQQTVDCLGPLLGRTPFAVFERPDLPADFAVPIPPNRKGRHRGLYRLESIRRDYSFILEKSWMHHPPYIEDVGDFEDCFFSFHAETPNRFLREDFLFCKRYIDDFLTCYLIDPIFSRLKDRSGTLLDKVQEIQEVFKQPCLDLRFEKRCLQGFLRLELRPKNHGITEKVFLSLFERPEWLDMWTISELGWWCAMGLSQYGSESMQSLINKIFQNKCEAIVWLFLGAHSWLHQDHVEFDSKAFEGVVSCCQFVDYGKERDYINELVGSVSQNDRIWLIKEIVQRAPEFGVCSYLGSYIFNYFVMRDKAETNLMLSVLLEEITMSRLQYIFEFAISMTVAQYQRAEITSIEFTMSEKYCDKLMRTELALYKLLKREEVATSSLD